MLNPHLEAIRWNRLLRDIHIAQVLPVIGPGLAGLAAIHDFEPFIIP